MRKQKNSHGITNPVTVRIILLALSSMVRLMQAKIMECTFGCELCWGPRYNQCMRCEDGFILASFQCLPISDAKCDRDFVLDTSDHICKRQITDVDFPCMPGTFND